VLVQFPHFSILINQLIPISLYVTLELVKVHIADVGPPDVSQSQWDALLVPNNYIERRARPSAVCQTRQVSQYRDLPNCLLCLTRGERTPGEATNL